MMCRARWERLSVLTAHLLLGGLPLHRAAAQVAVDHSEIFLSPDGQTGTVFNVVNDGDEPLQARIYLNDWDRSESGENRFYPLGTTPGSCGTRVTVFPTVLQIAPKSAQPVRVTVQDADDRGCWTIAFAEVSQPSRTQGVVRVNYNLRLGVKIYLTPRGSTRLAELEGFATTEIRQRDSTLVQGIGYTAANVGTAPIVLRGSIEFRRPDNSVAARVAIEDLPMLPGARRTASTPIPPLAAGHYIALALLTYDGDEDLAGQVEVEVR
jgi:P pilus assembly chaperone PapD